MKIVIYIFIAFTFCPSCKGSDNCSKLDNISVGMNEKKAITIIGKPDSILLDFFGEDQFTYLYNTPFGSSDNIYINFSKNDSLILSKYGCK